MTDFSGSIPVVASSPSPRWRLAFLTPMGIAATVLLVVVVSLAVIAPIVWGDAAAKIDTNHLSEGSSPQHPFGTDSLGRDILLRVLVATRLSILLALAATAIGATVGILLGATPWLVGKRIGGVAIAIVNIAVAFPSLLLTLFFAVIFGIGIVGAVLAIGLAAAPWYGRVTQTLIAGVQQREFISAAQLAGKSRFTILVRHILPNIGEPLIVSAALTAGGSLLAFAGLSFLGIGVQAPEFDWGLLLNEGLNGIYSRPAGALLPGVAIVLAGLAFNLLGEVLAKQVRERGEPTTQWTRSRRHVASSSRDLSSPAESALKVRGLRVRTRVGGKGVDLVRALDLDIAVGESVGLVGESGSGKSLTAMAVARLLEHPVEVSADELTIAGATLPADGELSQDQQAHLGRRLGLVFQDASTALNPTMTIGRQLAEMPREHEAMTRRQARSRAIDRLTAVRVPSPAQRLTQYPFEFSGGMRQRAMIAMSLMGEPALIIADEPTTALDVTVQRQVLRVLRSVRDSSNLALLFISHDVTLISQLCDRVLVMYAGRIVEDLPVDRMRELARHPYTRALIAAVPDMESDLKKPLATISGRAPTPADRPPGCAFAPRCPLASAVCREQDPELVEVDARQRVACWHSEQVAAGQLPEAWAPHVPEGGR